MKEMEKLGRVSAPPVGRSPTFSQAQAHVFEHELYVKAYLDGFRKAREMALFEAEQQAHNPRCRGSQLKNCPAGECIIAQNIENLGEREV